MIIFHLLIAIKKEEIERERETIKVIWEKKQEKKNNST